MATLYSLWIVLYVKKRKTRRHQAWREGDGRGGFLSEAGVFLKARKGNFNKKMDDRWTLNFCPGLSFPHNFYPDPDLFSKTLMTSFSVCSWTAQFHSVNLRSIGYDFGVSSFSIRNQKGHRHANRSIATVRLTDISALTDSSSGNSATHALLILLR